MEETNRWAYQPTLGIAIWSDIEKDAIIMVAIKKKMMSLWESLLASPLYRNKIPRIPNPQIQNTFVIPRFSAKNRLFTKLPKAMAIKLKKTDEERDFLFIICCNVTK